MILPAETQQADIEDAMMGFDDAPTPVPAPGIEIETPEKRKKWDFTTLTSLSGSYNYQKAAPNIGNADYRGLSRLKVKLQPEFRYKFNSKWSSLVSASAFYDLIYRINDRSDYATETLDNGETELEFREAYLRGTVTNDFDIKLGRQIVVWGKSDSIRVVDVLNPLDFREPGMVDIEDLRLPVTMAKADYYFSDWNLSAIVIPEIRFNKTPAFGSDFSLSDQPAPPKEMPDSDRDWEYALALSGVFNAWDLSFHAARYYDDQAHIIISPFQPNTVTQGHSHLTLLGFATNVAAGNLLLKMESAYIDGLEFTNHPTSFSRMDIMLGVDYSGITDATFSIEVVNRHINDYESNLSLLPDSTKEDESQISLRYTGSFLREKVNLVALTSILGTSIDDGAFYRGSIEYEIMDAMTVMLGGIVYQSGDNFLLKQIADNDRVFFDMRYSF